MSFLFLLDCNGVCQKCDEAKTELGGYCLCYPNGYYSAGVHVEKRGVCILPPGEDATSIPRMDDVQPDHIKKPKKLHAEDGPHSNSDDGDDTAEECIQTVAIAAMRGDLKGIQNCLDVGWDVNAKDMIGTTALHHAAYNGKVNAIALLIKAGADMNAKNNNGWTVLYYAAMFRKLDAIAALIKAGADVNAKDNNGMTALDVATMMGETDVIQLLSKGEL